MKLNRLTQASIALASAIVLNACGSDPSNEGLGNDELRDNFYYPGQSQASSSAWDDVAGLLGMGANKADDADALATELATAPTIYSNTDTSDANVVAFQQAVGTKLVTGAVQSQCASVVGISDPETAYYTDSSTGNDVALTGAVNYYYMKYKLTNPATGQAEDNARVGIIVAPAATAGNYPLVMYGHGGASGLAYSEIASLFGALQTKAIIAAPSFPGENVFCSANTTTGEDCSDYTSSLVHTAAETQSGAHIYDQDVIEYQGMYNCIAYELGRLSALGGSYTLPKLDTTLTATNTNYTALDLPFYNGTKSINIATTTIELASSASVPYTLLVGADRGGFVAQLAAARSGWYSFDRAKDADSSSDTSSSINSTLTSLSMSTSNFVQPTPVGVMALGANASMTMGLNRVALQYMVLDLVDSTPFSQLPGYALLGDLFAQYGNGAEGWTTAKAAGEIAVRDYAFLGTFAPLAVRDWTEADEYNTTTAKGEMIRLHGISDVVVDYSQAKIGDGIASAVNTYYLDTYNASVSVDQQKVPGLLNSTFAFQAADTFYDASGEFTSDTDGDGSADDYNHVSDASFLTGKLVGLATEHAAVIAADGSDDNANQTIETFAAGIASGSNGLLDKTATRASFYPVFNRKTTTAFDGTKVEETARTDATPVDIAASWIIFHGLKAANSSTYDIDYVE